MVAEPELVMKSEMKNTVPSQTVVDTTQVPRVKQEGEDVTHGGKLQNSSTAIHSRPNTSPNPKIKIDAAIGLSQGENALPQLEMKARVSQSSVPASGLSVTDGKSLSVNAIPPHGNTSSLTENSLQRAIGPLQHFGHSQKAHGWPSSQTHGNGNGSHQTQSCAPMTAKAPLNSVPNVQPPLSKDDTLLDTIKTSSEGDCVTRLPSGTQQYQSTTPTQLKNTVKATSMPPPSPKLISSIEMQDIDPTTVVDDVVHKLRAPLINKYGSFIHPTDTSLSDARKRLQSALEQTRILRSAFTNRLYEKYRVLLRPVPKSINEIIGTINADPVAANATLTEATRILKEEKEIEKKEAQSAASAVLSSGDSAANSAALMASSLETAEQLAYIGAGLNLVILPEDDIDVHDMVLQSFEHRGPTNPETGQRVGGISAAAATAAEVLLDRVRRARALRVDRQKQRVTQGTPDEATVGFGIELSVTNPVLSMLNLVSNNTADSQTVVVEQRAPLPVAPKAPKKIAIMKASSSSHLSTVLGKSGRSRVQMPTSSINLLSLNPSAEELPYDDVKLASTKALVAQGVGTIFQPKSFQNRYRHPHPDSLGGRSSAMQSSGRVATSHGPNPVGIEFLDLPMISVGKERRFKKAVKVSDRRVVSNERVVTCLDSILAQFAIAGEIGSRVNTQSEPEYAYSHNEAESISPTPICVENKSENHSCSQRRTTEIGLLCGMHHSAEGCNKPMEGDGTVLDQPLENASGISATSLTKLAVEAIEADQPLEPILAFSVLHALGLVRDTHHSQHSLSNNMMNRIASPFSSNKRDQNTNEKCWPGGSAKLNSLCQRVSKNKRRFSEYFLESSFKVEKDVSAKKKKISAQVPKREVILTGNPENDVTSPGVEELNNPFKSETVPEGIAFSQSEEHSLKAESRGSGEVMSIRGGGGGEDPDFLDDERTGSTRSGKKRRVVQSGFSKEKRTGPDNESPRRKETDAEFRSRNPNYESSSSLVHKVSSAKRETNEILSQPSVQASPMVNSNCSSSSFSPPTSNSAMMVAARQHQAALAQRSVNQAIAASHERFHHSPASLHLPGSLHHSSLNRMPGHPGNMTDFFGGLHASAQRGPFGSLTDWSQLDAANATVGLLPSHSSLAMGLHQQHAAMVNLSVDRAARAMLVREHQNAAVAAAQRQAAARASGVAGLSAQHAAILMGQQGGAALFQSSASRFQHIGGHPGSAMLPSPAATMMSQGASMGAHLQAMQRAAGSRPGSSSSVISGRTSRPSSAKGRSKINKEEKLLDETANSKLIVPSHGVDDCSNKKRSIAERPQSSSLIGGIAERRHSSSSIGGIAERPGSSSSIGGVAERPQSSSSIGCNSRSGTSGQSKPLVKQYADSQGETKNSYQSLDVVQEMKSPKLSPQTSVPLQVLRHTKSVAHDILSLTKGDAPEESGKEVDKVIKNDVTQPRDLGKSAADSQQSVAVLTAGMQFFAPNIPDSLSSEMANEVLEARVHVAAKKVTDCNSRALLEFVQSVGAAVPIPKGLVGHPLKERFASPIFKASGTSSQAIPREVVAAIVLIWLWVQHKEIFQRAFAKSGRIDVDPECKWLIQAAVDTATRALAAEFVPKTNSVGDGKSKGMYGLESVANTELQVASTVSKALMTEMCIDGEIDVVLPVFDDLVELLDEARMCSLRSKCSERSLLAALIARTATMSESFSHSYVSSMVRAGEALGHGELFELVQDEKTLTSTMIPYDIFSDEHGAWEDPCRLPFGFTPGLAGEDLMKRAHARAMIHKSLRKMQDRNNIRGGTTNSGPYTESTPAQSPTSANTSTGPGRGLQRIPSGSLKKRSSFTFSGDVTQPGSGSAPARSIAQYNPNHFSAPLFWDSNIIENTPYGKHVKGPRPSVFSLTKSMVGGRGGKGDRGSSCADATLNLPMSTSAESYFETDGPMRSTEEVEWIEVAAIFETVNLEGTPSVKRSKKMGHLRTNTVGPQKIIAPFCRKLESALTDIYEEESDIDEDLSDETILQRHQHILDVMKEKLDRVMENRPLTAQQRARNRAEARRNTSIDGF